MEFKYDGKSDLGGTYKIVNKINGRTYVGSAKTFKTRWKGHAWSLEKGKHHSKFLQADYNKCGSDAFFFEVVEVIAGTKEDRVLAEQKLINSFLDKEKNMCYNMSRVAMSSDGYSPADPEKTRKKRSEASKRMWSDPEYWKCQSEVQREKTREQWANPEIREKRVKRIREVCSTEEHRKKLSESSMGKVVGQETRRKISEKTTEKNKQLWQFKEYRDKVIEGRKKAWASNPKRKEAAAKLMKEMSKKSDFLLRDPDGNIVRIQNLEEFCRNHPAKLVGSCLSKLNRGIIEVYKGWTRPDSDPALIMEKKLKLKEEQRQRGTKQFTKTIQLISPAGHLVEVVGVTKFCKENKLCPILVRDLLSNRRESYKGWTNA